MHYYAAVSMVNHMTKYQQLIATSQTWCINISLISVKYQLPISPSGPSGRRPASALSYDPRSSTSRWLSKFPPSCWRSQETSCAWDRSQCPALDQSIAIGGLLTSVPISCSSRWRAALDGACSHCSAARAFISLVCCSPSVCPE